MPRGDDPEPFLPLFVPMAKLPAVLPQALPGELAAEFEEWWKTYPRERRISKGHARLAYARARRIASAGTLLEGVRRYAADCVSRNREPQFICHPTTWLNGERWEDEVGGPVVAATNGGNGNGAANHHDQNRPLGRADTLLAAGIAAGNRVWNHKHSGGR